MEAFSWTWFCVPALWDVQAKAFQAVMEPRLGDKWKMVQGPCVSPEVKTDEKTWFSGQIKTL